MLYEEVSLTNKRIIHNAGRRYINAIKKLRQAEEAAHNANADLKVAQEDAEFRMRELENLAGKPQAGAVAVFQLEQKYANDSDVTVIPKN